MVIQERMSIHTKDNSDLDPNTMAEGGALIPFSVQFIAYLRFLLFNKKTSPAIKKNKQQQTFVLF